MEAIVAISKKIQAHAAYERAQRIRLSSVTLGLFSNYCFYVGLKDFDVCETPHSFICSTIDDVKSSTIKKFTDCSTITAPESNHKIIGLRLRLSKRDVFNKLITGSYFIPYE